MQMGALPVVHGSALVAQGHSQALVTATVADNVEQAKTEGITGEQRKQLMVQWNDRVAATSQVCFCNTPESVDQVDTYIPCKLSSNL